MHLLVAWMPENQLYIPKLGVCLVLVIMPALK
jgi:hypothetical protein